MDPLSFGAPPPRRGPSLTPMIDVVFLLLVFFMLAARFGTEQALELKAAGAGGSYDGPPRLLDVLPQGMLLNGVALDEPALAAELAALSESPSDLVVLRGRNGAETQRIVDALDLLTKAGFRNVALVE